MQPTLAFTTSGDPIHIAPKSTSEPGPQLKVISLTDTEFLVEVMSAAKTALGVHAAKKLKPTMEHARLLPDDVLYVISRADGSTRYCMSTDVTLVAGTYRTWKSSRMLDLYNRLDSFTHHSTTVPTNDDCWDTRARLQAEPGLSKAPNHMPALVQPPQAALWFIPRTVKHTPAHALFDVMLGTRAPAALLGYILILLNLLIMAFAGSNTASMTAVVVGILLILGNVLFGLLGTASQQEKQAQTHLDVIWDYLYFEKPHPLDSQPWRNTQARREAEALLQPEPATQVAAADLLMRTIKGELQDIAETPDTLLPNLLVFDNNFAPGAALTKAIAYAQSLRPALKKDALDNATTYLAAAKKADAALTNAVAFATANRWSLYPQYVQDQIAFTNNHTGPKLVKSDKPLSLQDRVERTLEVLDLLPVPASLKNQVQHQFDFLENLKRKRHEAQDATVGDNNTWGRQPSEMPTEQIPVQKPVMQVHSPEPEPTVTHTTKVGTPTRLHSPEPLTPDKVKEKMAAGAKQ